MDIRKGLLKKRMSEHRVNEIRLGTLPDKKEVGEEEGKNVSEEWTACKRL